MNIKFNGRCLILALIFGLSVFGANIPAIFCQDNQPDNLLNDQVDNQIEAIFTQVALHLSQRDFPSALSLFDTLPPDEAQKVMTYIADHLDSGFKRIRAPVKIRILASAYMTLKLAKAHPEERGRIRSMLEGMLRALDDIERVIPKATEEDAPAVSGEE